MNATQFFGHWMSIVAYESRYAGFSRVRLRYSAFGD